MAISAYILWGAGSQAKILRELLGPEGPRLVAIFDTAPEVRSPWPDVPLYTGRKGFEAWLSEQGRIDGIGCLVAIGGHRGADRTTIQRELAREGLIPFTAVHRTSFVSNSARLGPGCQVLAHAVVGVEAQLGEACIINTGATVDHECRLGDGVHICPGAHLAGLVTVEDNVMIGTGASVLPRIRVGAGAIVGAGAVVTRDVPSNSCVVGNPAHLIVRKNDEHY